MFMLASKWKQRNNLYIFEDHKSLKILIYEIDLGMIELKSFASNEFHYS